MRLPLLFALTSVGACATFSPGAETAPPGTSPGGTAPATPTASVSVIREPEGGALVLVSFRTEAGVAISARHALRVETPTGAFEAALSRTPQRAAEGAMTVSSAEYSLAEAGVRALDAAGNLARVGVHDGREYRTYPVSRSDFLE